MIILLKIIYKAFYKTRDRKNNTLNAFSGLITLYLTITLFAFILIILRNNFPYLKNNSVKVILGFFVFGIGFSTFQLCVLYVKKKFQQEGFFENIKYSVAFCRILFILINILGVIYVPGTFLFLQFLIQHTYIN